MPIEAWDPNGTALTALANAWLAAGVAAFSIAIDGAAAVTWPPRVAIGRPDLAAPIPRAGKSAGEIRIKGPFGRGAQLRATADAQLVGKLLEAEADLAAMTDALINVQDRLLAVYDLARGVRPRAGVAQTLLALAEVVGHLLDVEGAALVLALPDSLAGKNTSPLVVQHPRDGQDQAWLAGLLPVLRLQQQAVLWQGQAAAGLLPGKLASLLTAPIEVCGRIAGGLIFWSERDGRFAAAEIKLATAIAGHAAAQIENELLYQQSMARAGLETEMALARRVQRDLLPKAPPQVPGLDFYACTRPASQVGGDYFDFVGGPEGSTAFLVGDVSGKGVPAALVLAMMRAIVRSILGQAAQAGPGALLVRANHELYEDLTGLAMFATLFAAQYHSGGPRLLYANAGHAPVIFRPAAGPAVLLEAGSPPVGVLARLECTDCVLEFGPGDLLVAASDGFNEARSPAGELFGIECLLACVESNAHLDPEPLSQALFAAVEAYSGGELQEDDQTLLIARGIPT